MTEPTPTYTTTVSTAAALIRKKRIIDEVERITNGLNELGRISREALVGWSEAGEAEQNQRYAGIHDLRLRLDALLATEEG